MKIEDIGPAVQNDFDKLYNASDSEEARDLFEVAKVYIILTEKHAAHMCFCCWAEYVYNLLWDPAITK